MKDGFDKLIHKHPVIVIGLFYGILIAISELLVYWHIPPPVTGQIVCYILAPVIGVTVGAMMLRALLLGICYVVDEIMKMIRGK